MDGLLIMLGGKHNPFQVFKFNREVCHFVLWSRDNLPSLVTLGGANSFEN